MTSIQAGTSPESFELTGTGGHYSGDSSQHCMLKLGCTSEKHLEDKDLRDMMSITVQNANEYENGGGTFGNALEVKTKIEKQEGSVNDSSFESSKSDVELGTEGAMVNNSLHNQGLKRLEDKEFRDMVLITVHNANEHENGGGSFENAFEVKTKVEKQEGSTNDSSFPSSTSDVQLGTQEAMVNSSLHNQGLKDENDAKLLENPLETARVTEEFEIVPSIERERMESNANRTAFDFENFGVKTSEHSKMTEATSIEISNDGEQREDSCLDGEKNDALDEGSQKVVKPVNGLKCLDLHFNELPKPDKDGKNPASLDNGSEPFHDVEEFTLPPTMEEIYIEDKLDTEADKLEGLQCHTSAGDPTISDVDQSINNTKGGSLDQCIPASETFTAFISNDIDGWQRFDVDDGNNVGYGNNTSNRESHPLELWEQLLVNSLEEKEEVKEASSLELGGIEPPLQDGNWQIGFASPGNPFIEGLDRLSNFSETEGAVFTEDFQSPLFSNNIARAAFLHGNEGLSDAANRNEEAWSGVLHNFVKPGEQQQATASVLGNSDASKVATQFGSQSQTDTNYPSFAEATGFSLQAAELFEAPSFMSLVDPESHELFKACMPVYQISTNVSGHENGGEKWEANFDLMIPSQSQNSSLQEITRSVSLPRIATSVNPADTSFSTKGTQISAEVKNTSLKSLTPSTSPKAKPSILLSPKLSPLVKKMVQKVRTTPAVASKVLSTANNMLNPNTVDNKIKQGSIWSRCLCCFNRNKK